jgi:hypothetical protein
LGNLKLRIRGAGQGLGSIEEISFQIDTYANGNAENPPGVGIMQNGTLLPGVRTDGEIVPNNGTVTVPVSISWNPTSASFTTVGLTTDAAFEDIPHTFVGDDSYSWVFSARTGGAFEGLFIDNLEIRIDSADAEFRILSIEKSVVAGEGGDPDTISVTVTWQSREERTYGIYAAPDFPADIGDWTELDDSFPAAVGAETTSYTEDGIPIDTKRRIYQIRDTTSR